MQGKQIITRPFLEDIITPWATSYVALVVNNDMLSVNNYIIQLVL